MRDYREIQKELAEHQNKVDELIAEMEESGWRDEFAVDLGNNYMGFFPSAELGEERVCAIYKGYYYTHDQCWSGDNDITIFSCGASRIKKSVKSFFKGFGDYVSKDEKIENGERIQCLVDNWIDSCDAELMQEFEKVLFGKERK